MTIRMELQQYEAKAVCRGTKRYLECMADIGLDEPLALPVLQVDGAGAGPVLLVLAAVHGDEYEGVETVLRLYRSLRPERLAGSVIMIPAANLLAYRGGTRVTPEDGVNMARAFPGNPDGTPTERLAYHLHHRFIAQADFLLDLHSGGAHYAVSTLVGYYENEASETGRRSRAAAEAFGAELLWAHTDIAPGRSVSSALSLGVPWLYTEAYGGRRIRREDAELFYAGAYRLMRHLRMLGESVDETDETGKTGDQAGAHAEQAVQLQVPAHTGAKEAGRCPPMRIYGDGNFDGSETAEADGFFIPAVSLNTIVRTGDKIGAVCRLDGRELQEVRATRGGMVVMLAGSPPVRAGDPLFMLAETEPPVLPQ
jgi:predicted deacylase